MIHCSAKSFLLIIQAETHGLLNRHGHIWTSCKLCSSCSIQVFIVLHIILVHSIASQTGNGETEPCRVPVLHTACFRTVRPQREGALCSLQLYRVPL